MYIGITYLVTGVVHVLVAEATLVSPRMVITQVQVVSDASEQYQSAECWG